MNKNINLEEIMLDDDKNPIVYVEKKLKKFEILEVGKICCYDYPSLCKSLEYYISKHKKEWDLKDNETVGYLIKGRKGYNYVSPTFKTVVFYKIKDKL